MGKQRKKLPRPPKRLPFKEKVVMLLRKPVSVGFSPGERRPACFWMDGEPYAIQHFLKEWKDDWNNTYYRVITDKGLFDIYRHRRAVSLDKRQFEDCWRVDKQLELPPRRPARPPASTPTSAKNATRRRTPRTAFNKGGPLPAGAPPGRELSQGRDVSRSKGTGGDDDPGAGPAGSQGGIPRN